MKEKTLSKPEILDPDSSQRNQIDLLTEALRKRALEIPPDIYQRTIVQLEEIINPSVLHRRLKKSFWNEYERAIAHTENDMKIINVYKDLCSRQYFYKFVVENDEVFAWMLFPPTKYEAIVEEALEFGVERIRKEILTAPLQDSKGKFDNYVAGTILQAVKFLDARVKGSPLQRIEQKNLHLHAQHPTKGGVTRDQLNQELEEIKQRLNMSQTPQLAHKVPDDPE